MKPLAFAVAATTLFLSNAAFANTRICVSVQQKSWYKPVAAPAAAPAPASDAPPPAPMIGPAPGPGGPHDRAGGAALWRPHPAGAGPGGWGAPPPPQAAPPPVRKVRPPANPHEIDPTVYLQRMLEYEMTHEPGFAAVDQGCAHTISVELYQLQSGWTVFARYSGTEREEKIDHAEIDEFDQLAQRIAFALLRNRSITHTITRENVLRADSETNLRTINGTEPPDIRHGHRGPPGAAGDSPGRRPAGGGRDPPADAGQHSDRLPAQAAGLGPRRLWPGQPGNREHRHPPQRPGRHVDYNGSVLVGLHFRTTWTRPA